VARLLELPAACQSEAFQVSWQAMRSAHAPGFPLPANLLGQLAARSYAGKAWPIHV